MGFFDAVTDVINPANLATAGGFLVGGPPGAAIGRGAAKTAFGSDWKPGGHDAGLGGGVQGAMEGAAVGYGGQALGGALSGSGAAGGAASGAGAEGVVGEIAPEAVQNVVGTGPAVPIGGGGGAAGMVPGMGAAAGMGGGASMAGGGGGGAMIGAGASEAAGGGGGPFSSALEGLNSYEKLMLGSQGLSTAGQIYSGIEQGQLQDERRERSRRFTNKLAPYVGEMMEGVY